MIQTKQLKQSLKSHWVWAIAFGSAIGWGAFVLPVDWISKSGPLGVILGFLIGAFLMIIIGVSYGFMIERLPKSGGEFTFAYYGFGRTHAFICGWFLTLGYMSIVALNASALGLLGKFVLPDVAKVGYMYTIAGWDVYAGEVTIAVLALFIFAFLNIRGSSLSGFAQFLFCLTLLGGVIFLTIAMFLHPTSSLDHLQPWFKPGVSSVSAILAIIAISPWAYVGFDNIPQAAEEFRFSPKKSFRLIVLAILCAALVYSLTVLMTAISMPWQNIVRLDTIWGTGQVVENNFGMIGLILLSISLCMGIFTGLNGFYMSTSRLLFAMGRAKILPDSFSKLHSKYDTPYVGILFTCSVTLLAPFFGREVLLWIVDMSAIGVTIAYLYCCTAALKFTKQSSEGTKVSPLKKILFFIGILSSASFFLLLVVPGSPGFLGKPSWIALGIWIFLGVFFYFTKYREVQKIPKETMDQYIIGEARNRDEK